MTHVIATLSGLVFGTATTLALAATVQPTESVIPPPGLTAAPSAAVGVAPTYPHNINPDPNGPYYINPYDPYAEGYPDDVTPPVIGLSPPPPDPQPVHPPKHR